MLLQLHAKQSVKAHTLIFYKLGKLYVGSLLAQKLENKVFPKNIIWVSFKVKLLQLHAKKNNKKQNKKQKKGKFDALILDTTWKVLFWVHFEPHFVQKLKTGSLTESRVNDFNTICYCNFMQKIKKVPYIDFSQILRKLLLYLPLKLQIKAFPKKIISVKLKCLCCLQIFEKVSCINSWYVKYLILDQFWVPLGPKVSKQDLSKENQF